MGNPMERTEKGGERNGLQSVNICVNLWMNEFAWSTEMWANRQTPCCSKGAEKGQSTGDQTSRLRLAGRLELPRSFP